MALDLADIDMSTARWTCEADPEIWIDGIPVTPGMRQEATRRIGASLETDGHHFKLSGHQVVDVAIEQALQSWKEWGGLANKGEPIKLDRAGIALVASYLTDEVLTPATKFFLALYHERRDARLEAAGN